MSMERVEIYCSIEKKQKETLDKLIAEGLAVSRSEIIRASLNQYFRGMGEYDND